MHSPLYLIFSSLLLTGAAIAADTPSSSENSKAIELEPVIVNDSLDKAREDILPGLGATSFGMSQMQIEDLPQGADAPFSQILLRAPGVAEDSAGNGDLHIRGEHGNLQYRINDVLLPEGISGFGLELDPRFVNSLQLITGSLPAQYGFRTAGVVDIQTKSGTLAHGSGIALFTGSYDTLRPSFEIGGGSGESSYFVNGSYDHNAIGIENPTASGKPVHDATDQGKLFSYLSWVLDRTSRVSVMLSASDSKFQVPDTPGLTAGTSSNGTPWVPGTAYSAKLDENQNEQNYYGVVAYQKSAGRLNAQISAFGRMSAVHFIPDPVGDLYFDGVASDVDRKLRSGGLQGDGSVAAADQHTVRAGFIAVDESVSAKSTTTVFPVDGAGNPIGPAFPIANNSRLHGLFAGAYLQDECRLTAQVTLNYGARLDVFDSSFDNEGQVSPRINLIYKPTESTAFHAGYARYFTPPPVESVPGSSVAQFDRTSNASSTDQDDPVKAERADYFDLGASQTLISGLQVGLDGYYKKAKNQLDDGLFGQTLILSAFNYAKGKIYGLELTGSYTAGHFSTYVNLAHSVAKGTDWSSSQFLFGTDELAYVKDHWIHLDHDQTLSGSFGAAYHWTQRKGGTRAYLDLLYGSGLRTSVVAPDGSSIPNGGTVPAYGTVNIGAEQSFKTGHGRAWKLRVDIMNLTNKSYELRNGSGIGVGAAQYGMRRGVFDSVSYEF